MSEFEDKLVNGLKEFADCAHEHLKCEKCGAKSNLFGWMAFCKEYHELEQRLAAAEAAKEDAIADARAQFDKYMDCHKAYREMQDKLAAAEASTNALYREIDELRAAIKAAGIVLQRAGTDLVAINVPADECRRLLREACIGYENNFDDASSDKRLRRVPIFHTWYEQAARAAGVGE